MMVMTALSAFPQSDEDTAVKKVEVFVEETFEDSSAYPPSSENTEYFEPKYLYAYATDSIEKRTLADSALQRMKQDEEFWYADHVFEKEKQKKLKQRTPLREQTWFQTLMWMIIIGGFVTALILYLNDSGISLFRKNVNAFSESKQIEETENIFEINYRDRIDKAVKAGNYRLAIRLLFLQMLKTMAGKNMIQYKQDRTNFDYLMQLRNTGHYNDFFRITRNYEYTWYGNFPVNEEAWRIIKNDFEKFDSLLNRK
jgi:hypothetical protein